MGSSPALEAAFALESTLDELIFVLGAVLVTALALGVAPGAAGTLLALVAAGSLLARLVYGKRSWQWPLDKRFVAAVVVLWAGTLPLVFAPSVRWVR